MSEDQEQNGFRTIRVNTNVTSPVALVLVMLVEFIMFAFYPFIFLVLIPIHYYIDKPEERYEYNRSEKYVVLNKSLTVYSYVDLQTKEDIEGGKPLTVPKGAKLEVMYVDMKGYPLVEPRITISYYYDEQGNGYTLHEVRMDWIEKPDDILSDLDVIRNAEVKNNRDVRTKVIAGILGTIAFAALDVFLIYLVFKKNLTRHVIFASALVMVVFMLLFVLGPIGSNMYYSKDR